MTLEITQKEYSAKRVALTVQGRLDATTAPELKAEIKQLVATGFHRLIIDLAGVPFIDSSGLAALVVGLKATRETGGMLKLVGLNDQAMTVFKITLLDRVFEFYQTIDAALTSPGAER